MHPDGCSTIRVHVCVSEEGWQKEKRAALHRAIGKRDRRQKGEKGRKQKSGKRWGRSSVKESTIVFRRRREGVCDFSATTCKKWRNMVYYTGKENISATSSGCGRRSGICNIVRMWPSERNLQRRPDGNGLGTAVQAAGPHFYARCIRRRAEWEEEIGMLPV